MSMRTLLLLRRGIERVSAARWASSLARLSLSRARHASRLRLLAALRRVGRRRRGSDSRARCMGPMPVRRMRVRVSAIRLWQRVRHIRVRLVVRMARVVRWVRREGVRTVRLSRPWGREVHLRGLRLLLMRRADAASCRGHPTRR